MTNEPIQANAAESIDAFCRRLDALSKASFSDVRGIHNGIEMVAVYGQPGNASEQWYAAMAARSERDQARQNAKSRLFALLPELLDPATPAWRSLELLTQARSLLKECQDG